ncbi:uncharacterized protein LOC113506539 [Trichoplusia ni]|uniref:Uncharacterized protein LOC113506539 n=1 Tax=Trichoplusia ni TaxID=7111 RepID=A0A7E5WXD9_TRINI|nr:uncharacterized protein LOC113506539 [Trichoplusia ni]
MSTFRAKAQPNDSNMEFILVELLLFLLTSCTCSSDWVSEWMGPVQGQFQGDSQRRFDDDLKMVQMSQYQDSPKEAEYHMSNNEMNTVNLKIKLEDTLRTAKSLAETLKVQIIELVARENLLKEAIVNGRPGVSTLTVSTMSQVPRSYIIRDGRWMLCNGMIQFPVQSQTSSTNLFNGLFTEPRCIGREVSTVQDPCVFNSVIKYEVVPTTRRLVYTEDDYLCLKPSFNKTLERYMSVTRQLINETCKNGIIRSLAENTLECGIRVLSEYSFYPHRSSAAATLPLEYCTEKDGSCKLIVAWHVSNATIENFEFLKNEHNFKKYFIKSGPYIEHVI